MPVDSLEEVGACCEAGLRFVELLKQVSRSTQSCLMGVLQNQNQTLGFSQPEVTHLGSTAELSAAVNNILIWLGVMIFILQLCLALFFMLRCSRYDSRIREALKHPDTVKKILGINKESPYQLCDTTGSSAPAMSAMEESYEEPTGSLCAPSIHWDLVQ